MNAHAKAMTVWFVGASLAAISLSATQAVAQAKASPAAAAAEAVRNVFANPPAALPEPDSEPPRLSDAGAPPRPPSLVQAADSYVDSRKNIEYKFTMEFTDGVIRNPWTLTDDKVNLRAYHGSAVDPDVPFLAPTITMRPGQTVRIKLDNQMFELVDGKRLPVEACKPTEGVNVPHCFNDTNLHAHGLWVSPSGNSDNVLISINPGVKFDYEYAVPSDHPAGTFWYHPHKHGSTALQVSSGMDGALIIKDDRIPTATTAGDIDILLRNAQGVPFADKVLLFQQVQYACFDKDGNIQKSTSGPKRWVCNTGQTGVIRNYKQFGTSSNWKDSGRFTSINGKVQPPIKELTAGSFERWRLIHGGVREAVNFMVLPMAPDAPDFTTVKGEDQAAFMKRYCAGAALPMWEVALDGLTRQQVRRVTEVRLEPGYRSDVVTYFPTAGRYCVIDGASAAIGSPTQEPEPIKMLGVAVVAAGSGVADPGAELQRLMLNAADAIPDPAIKNQVKADLANGLRLTKFVWHKTIDTDELNSKAQELAFNIDIKPTPALFEVNDPSDPDKGGPYDPARIDRRAKLGDVQEWHLTSTFASHPFHIHVNPFQVKRILNAAGQPVTELGQPGYDPDYAGMIDQWKDTLFVKQGYQIYVRTRYERYIGEYVLHCHILDHEDQGMMANVKIGIPDGAGGTAEAHGPGGDHGGGHGGHGM